MALKAGCNYDYAGAARAGVRPDETGHWPYRDPATGLILKGTKHPRYYSSPKGK